MPSRQQIKHRIKSVKNTRQITKAMQLVAASRLRRAQESAQNLRPFAEAFDVLLAKLQLQAHLAGHPLFAARQVKRRLIVVISSDRGLAGAYDSNVLRHYVNEVKADKATGIASSAVAIGRKAVTFIARLSAVELSGVYTNFPDHPSEADLQPIIAQCLQHFLDKSVDIVDVIYTKHLSSVRHETAVLHLLPAGSTKVDGQAAQRPTDFEPSAQLVLESAARRFVEAELLHALLESSASEYSMRMLAMKNATDNATELADDLTLAYNNARQAAITQELSEISGGVEALEH